MPSGSGQRHSKPLFCVGSNLAAEGTDGRDRGWLKRSGFQSSYRPPGARSPVRKGRCPGPAVSSPNPLVQKESRPDLFRFSVTRAGRAANDNKVSDQIDPRPMGNGRNQV